MTRIVDKLRDFFEMGVPVCWMIDPLERRAWIVTKDRTTQVADGILRAGEIEMPLAEIFE